MDSSSTVSAESVRSSAGLTGHLIDGNLWTPLSYPEILLLFAFPHNRFCAAFPADTGSYAAVSWETSSVSLRCHSSAKMACSY